MIRTHLVPAAFGVAIPTLVVTGVIAFLARFASAVVRVTSAAALATDSRQAFLATVWCDEHHGSTRRRPRSIRAGQIEIVFSHLVARGALTRALVVVTS